MRTSRGTIRSLAGAVALTLALAACGGDDEEPETTDPETEEPAADGEETDGEETDEPAASGETVQMNIANFAGDLGAAIAEVAEGFEEEFNVEITWAEGSATDNVARVAAAAGNQEWDAVFVENQNHYLGSDQGLWAPVDTEIVDLYGDLHEVLRRESDDGVPIGVITTGLYYNSEEFEANGWDPPTSYQDLKREEFCNWLGLLHIDQSYGLYTVLGLGADAVEGYDTEEDLQAAFESGLSQMEELAPCIPTIEASGGSLEQKIQVGEYLVGTHGSVRIMPLIQAGAPVEFVNPEEGSFLVLSTISVPADAPNPELGQEFANFFLRPESQEQLMESVGYGPTNSTVEVGQEYADLGVPTPEDVTGFLNPSEPLVIELRPEWTDAFDRVL